jgi:SAM-dependent methyltransferase
MIKNFIKKIILNKKVASFIIKPILIAHSFSYTLAGIFSSLIEDGTHPKHRIIKYFEWFNENIDKEDVVIDIGCNKGYMAHYLSKSSKYVYGIEILPQFIDYANINYKSKNLKFIHHDATTFDYGKLEYYPNVITLSNVLEHIEDRVNFLKKIKSKFKQNIKFLIRVPMIDREWIVIYKRELDIDFRLDKTHFIEYTKESFFNEIKLSGLYIKDYQVKWGELYAICE